MMEKKDLANIMSDILVPIGFKRKGNYWVINGNEINKIVNLQKSQFSNSFYINYGFIINSIPLNGVVIHVDNRLASKDSFIQQRITELLNLESNIPNEIRSSELKQFIVEKLVSKFQLINTEADILEDLRNRPHLNDIPLVVKKHFNLDLD